MLALAARRARQHDVDGLDATQTWTGVDYSAEQFRRDANVLDGVELMGDGIVADLLWARPVGDRARDRRPAGDRLVLRGPGLGGARA